MKYQHAIYQKQLLTTQEAMHYLGVENLPKHSLPLIQVGEKIFYAKADLDNRHQYITTREVA